MNEPRTEQFLFRFEFDNEELQEIMHKTAMSMKMTGKREITLREAKKIKLVLEVEMPIDELFAVAN